MVRGWRKYISWKKTMWEQCLTILYIAKSLCTCDHHTNMMDIEHLVPDLFLCLGVEGQVSQNFWPCSVSAFLLLFWISSLFVLSNFHIFHVSWLQKTFIYTVNQHCCNTTNHTILKSPHTYTPWKLIRGSVYCSKTEAMLQHVTSCWNKVNSHFFMTHF